MTPTRPGHGRRHGRVLVVAAAGYGKTALAEADLADDGLRCAASQALVALGSSNPSAVVIEDLHELSADDRVEVLHAVATLDDSVPVTLTSREPLDPKSRGMLRGQVFERGPVDLALTPYAIARVLAEEYGVIDPEVPGRIHALTRGWPALVHFAADALSRRTGDDLAAALTRPGSAAAVWLETNVLATWSQEVATLLAAVADLDPITPELVEVVLDAQGGQPAAEGFEWLRRVGLILPHPRLDLLGREGFSVVPVVSTVMRRSGVEAVADTTRLLRAARWYEHNNYLFAAAEACARAGDIERALALVDHSGSDMIAQGDAAGLVALAAGRGLTGAAPPTLLTYGEALHMSGDSHAALRAYAPLVTTADATGWTAGLAYRVAAVHHTQGSLAAALETLDLVPGDLVPDDHDGVQWRAARVNILSMLGRDEEAELASRQTRALAERLGDARSLTAAYQAVAKTSSGARKEAHLGMALAAAREAGDVVAAARILGNQAYVLLVAARYTEAADVARQAVRATEIVRPTGALIAALHNLGEALTRIGAFAEARWHLERAVAISRRIGPNRIAAGLCGIGDIHRMLGNHEQGRATYEEAVVLARESDERQVLVPALAGLARLFIETSPADAKAAAEEANRLAPPSLASYALTALGWTVLAAGDRAQAAGLAERSVAAARSCQALDLLTEALELAAECAADPEAARTSLREALSIWRQGGAEPAASQIEVRLGRLERADSAARSRAREAAQRLQRAGVATVVGRSPGHDTSARSVDISVLGRFEVIIDGRPVPLTAWRSRQARTLLKILAGQRGRPATRDYLCELLWPDDDPIKTPHRLSVLLATVRGVLDPGRAWPAEHFVCSDSTGVWLDMRRVTLDADSLLADSVHAAALLADGERSRAREILSDIDHRYRGAAFEDEPYGDWAETLREETRTAWLRSLRNLATLSLREGRTNDASALLVRLLGADPYDERVHRMLVQALVRAGRHGEARRAFNNWAAAMRAVDAPGPDPALLAGEAARPK